MYSKRINAYSNNNISNESGRDIINYEVELHIDNNNTNNNNSNNDDSTSMVINEDASSRLMNSEIYSNNENNNNNGNDVHTGILSESENELLFSHTNDNNNEHSQYVSYNTTQYQKQDSKSSIHAQVNTSNRKWLDSSTNASGSNVSKNTTPKHTSISMKQSPMKVKQNIIINPSPDKVITKPFNNIEHISKQRNIPIATVNLSSSLMSSSISSIKGASSTKNTTMKNGKK